MASRSQMRLAQLTGSFGSGAGQINQAQGGAAVSAIAADDLSGVLSHLAASIQRIHGDSDFSNQSAGNFSHALTGSHGLKLAGDLDVNSSADIQGATNLQSTLAVGGDADFNGSNVGFAATVDSNFLPDGAGTRDLGGSGAEWNAYINALDASSAVLGTATVSDLTDNRIVIAGPSGELEDDANFTMDGATFTAAMAVDFTQTGGSTSAADFDVAGYAQFAGAVEVDGGLIANSAKIEDLTASRVTFAGTGGELEDSADLRFSVADRELRTVSGSFSGDVTVSGDLTVNGSVTTVNTEEVTIADHNIVLDSNNTLSAIVDGAGITIEGGTGDDLTFQWLAARNQMELKLGSNFANLKVNNLIADDSISAITGSFQHLDVTGDADINGQAILGSAAVSDLTEDRVVIVGASGELEDDGNFTFNGASLALGGAVTLDVASGLASLDGGIDVNSNMTVSTAGVAQATKYEVDSAADYIDVLGGALTAVAAAAFEVDAGSDIILDHAAGAAVKFQDANSEYGKIEYAASSDLALISESQLFLSSSSGNGIIIDAGDGSIALQNANSDFGTIAEAGSVMYVQSSTQLFASGSELRFDDDNRPASWAQGYITLSDNATEWADYEAALGGELSLLAGITAAAAGSVNAGKWTLVYADGAASVSAGTPIALSGFGALGSSIACNTAVAASNDKAIDVYVNGQLMLEGASNDFEIASGNIDFSFDIEGGDVIQIVIR